MRVVLRDGVGVDKLMEIPDGSTYVMASEMIPHVHHPGRGPEMVPRLDVRYIWAGRFDPATGAAVFVPDFLL